MKFQKVSEFSSQILTGFRNRALLVPEPHDADAAFFEDVDYQMFFKDFSDKDVFDACQIFSDKSAHITIKGF